MLGALGVDWDWFIAAKPREVDGGGSREGSRVRRARLGRPRALEDLSLLRSAIAAGARAKEGRPDRSGVGWRNGGESCVRFSYGCLVDCFCWLGHKMA